VDSLLFLPGNEVKRKENDQNEENTHGPEKATPDIVSPLLGVVKNPDGDGQTDDIRKEEKKEHNSFLAISCQRLAFSFPK